MQNLTFLFTLLLTFSACNQKTTADATQNSAPKNNIGAAFNITPIEHATAVFTWGGTVFYIDPVGGEAAFKGQPAPEIVLVTDIHGDHLNKETLAAVTGENTKIIVPQAVADSLSADMQSRLTIIRNDETTQINGFKITAIPMYNLRPEAKKFHPKGRGNGYLIERNGQRVYFSGDTEDIPEMRNLKNIHKAFVCMNLPYTMTVEDAAAGVIAFAPQEVYPYHYRGKNGLSDVDKFKKSVNAANAEIEVVQLDWYPEKD